MQPLLRQAVAHAALDGGVAVADVFQATLQGAGVQAQLFGQGLQAEAEQAGFVEEGLFDLAGQLLPGVLGLAAMARSVAALCHLLDDALCGLLVQAGEGASQGLVEQATREPQRIDFRAPVDGHLEVRGHLVGILVGGVAHGDAPDQWLAAQQHPAELDDGGEHALGEGPGEVGHVVGHIETQRDACVVAMLGQRKAHEGVDQRRDPLQRAGGVAQRGAGGDEGLDVGEVLEGEGFAQHQREVLRAADAPRLGHAVVHDALHGEAVDGGRFGVQQAGVDAFAAEDGFDVDAAQAGRAHPVRHRDEGDALLALGRGGAQAHGASASKDRSQRSTSATVSAGRSKG